MTVVSRGAMNAFLAVEGVNLPVNSIEDVYDKNYGLYMWMGETAEEYFRYKA